jgi:UDP-N-acetylmuramoyl-tripeptide--D-alanyl-D-alanine ligase
VQKISSKKIAEILHSGSNIVDVEISNVSTDSRNIKKGDLFIAIKGEVFDGHDFVKDVLAKGAEVVIVEKILPEVPAIRQIVVGNSKKAFAELGRYNREQFKGKVICLTGSAGKTTTKEEIKFVLSRFAPTYGTAGNFNNDVGVPKTLCDLNLKADYAVIEIGMSSKGEISNLINYIEPDIALITNVYPMHIEFFKNIEGIAEAKAEIFEGLSKKGTAVINKDSQCFDILEKQAEKHTKNIVTYGNENIISVEEVENSTKVIAKIGGREIEFTIPMIGKHYVYNALAALTIADIAGVDTAKAADYLKYFEAIEGRGKTYSLKLPDGGRYTLIDDSYSGQPEAMKFAIENLNKIKARGRKIAVLGKMAELGSFSKDKHIEIGKALAGTDIDIVVAVCPETKDILAQLNNKFETHYFENIEGLDEFLLNKLLQNNDIVLIKGARYSSKLYKIAEILIKNGA